MDAALLSQSAELLQQLSVGQLPQVLRGQEVVVTSGVVPDIADSPVQDHTLPAAELGEVDADAAVLPHSDQGAVAGNNDTAGVGRDLRVPEAQVLGQSPQEHLAQVQKGLLRSIGTALILTPDIAEVLTEQIRQTAYVVLLRFR